MEEVVKIIEDTEIAKASMNEIMKVEQDGQLVEAMTTLPQVKPDYVLEKFVIGKHETPEMRYAHCVLNIRIKYNKLRRTKIDLEKMNYQIEELKKKGDKMSEFKWRTKEIDREECEGAVLSTLRELRTLYTIWNTFDKKYTRAEINSAHEGYWDKRITQQANDDIMASGRISVGNLQALRWIGKGVVPELDHVREIEKNYLEDGENNVSVMIGIAVEKKLSEEEKKDFKLPCLDGLYIPPEIPRKVYICSGRGIAEAYNDIAREFLKDGSDLLLIVEDDTFPPTDAFIKLYKHIKQGKKVVGAWYLKRQEREEGAAIVIKNGKREFLEADGEVHEVKTLPMGCTLYTAEVFYKTNFPYFETTECLTQDSFFSQKLRDAGYKLYCDTSIRCKHIDRVTSKVYE